MASYWWGYIPPDYGETEEYRRIMKQNDIAVELFKERQKATPSAERITDLQVKYDLLDRKK